jgi:GH24 family phage-related lysozyme (muramidase)
MDIVSKGGSWAYQDGGTVEAGQIARRMLEVKLAYFDRIEIGVR